MTPAETGMLCRGHLEREKREWKRISWLASEIINISGKSVKFRIKPEQLISFADESEEIDIDKRKREAMESLRFFKAKFWMKIKGDKNDLSDLKFIGEKPDKAGEN